MSLFSDAWAAVSPNIDTWFGEAFLHRPMKHAGGRWIADPDRSESTVTAALDEVAVLSDPVGKRVAANTVAQNSTSHAMLDMARTALAARATDKDRFVRIRDGAVYEVTGVLDDDLARVRFRVARLGQSPMSAP